MNATDRAFLFESSEKHKAKIEEKDPYSEDEGEYEEANRILDPYVKRQEDMVKH